MIGSEEMQMKFDQQGGQAARLDLQTLAPGLIARALQVSSLDRLVFAKEPISALNNLYSLFYLFQEI